VERSLPQQCELVLGHASDSRTTEYRRIGAYILLSRKFLPSNNQNRVSTGRHTSCEAGLLLVAVALRMGALAAGWRGFGFVAPPGSGSAVRCLRTAGRRATVTRGTQFGFSVADVGHTRVQGVGSFTEFTRV
jgi:hypothetical protein